MENNMPHKPQEREYRDLEAVFTPVAVEEKESFIVEGYATTFDVPYQIGYSDIKFFECVRKGALDNADLTDVIFQLNHEGLTLARQRTNTLKLEIDDHGLKVTADLSGTQKGRELHEAIKNGLIDRMSWGFTVPEDGWEYDSNTRVSYITKVGKVFDVSAVSIPANQDTEIHARSYLAGVVEKRQQELLVHEQEEKQRAAAILEMTL